MNKNLCFLIMTLIFLIPISYSLITMDGKLSVSKLLLNNNTKLIIFSIFLVLTIFTLEYEKLRKNKFSYYFMYFFGMSCLLFCFFNPNDKCHLIYAFVAFFSVFAWLMTNAKNDLFLTSMLFFQLICSVFLFNEVMTKENPNVFKGEIIFLLIMFVSYIYIHFKNK